MRRFIYLLIIGSLIIGCGSKTTTIKTNPADEVSLAFAHSQVVAANNHLEQGKALYFRGKHNQAVKHLIRAISNDFKNWEAHYFLGLCQQKTRRYDRSIGSFNNSLKFCPSDKVILARLSYALGVSWEKEGYLHKAGDKYAHALKMNPGLSEARAGVKRIRAKTIKAETRKDKRDKKAF
jgi:tetratricopeptide (TPR) repeat protein